jgi:hypothetical protein
MATNISGTLGVDKIDPALIASTAEAETGTDNTKFITPLRLREGVNATGTAPIFAARAWVNFDGTGTVAIRASGNVSSITDNGVGRYTVNLTTAMPDIDYSFNVSVGGSLPTALATINTDGTNQVAPTTSAFRIYTYTRGDASGQDSQYINVAVFR